MYRIVNRTKMVFAYCLWSALCIQTATAQQNLALNKATQASGNETADFTHNKAVDGNTGTRWSGLPDGNGGLWFQVDLGSAQTINSVRIVWEFAFSRSFDIMVSTDNSGWTTAKHVEWSDCFQNGRNGIEQVWFDPITVRYVKLVNLERGTPYGISMYEFEVYANATVPATQPSFARPVDGTAFSFDGKKNPCEYRYSGHFYYGPWNFHNQPDRIFTDDFSYPGGAANIGKYTYIWNKLSVWGGISNMGGIRYGNMYSSEHKGGVLADIPGSIFPFSVDKPLMTTWKYTHSGTGKYNVTYDIWVSSANSPTEELCVDEIMIMLYTEPSFSPYTFASPSGSVTVNGNTFTLYKGAGHYGDQNGPPTKISWFVANTTITDFSADLSEFFAYAKSQNNMSGNYVRWFWAGSELLFSTGTVTTTEFTISDPSVGVTHGFVPATKHITAGEKTRMVLKGSNGTIRTGVFLPDEKRTYSLRGELLSGAGTALPDGTGK